MHLSDGLHFCLFLASASPRVGGETASTPISYMLCLLRFASSHWFYFVFIRCSTTTWIVAFSVFSFMYNLGSIEESTLEGSFDVSFHVICLGYSAQSPEVLCSYLRILAFCPLICRCFGGLLVVP